MYTTADVAKAIDITGSGAKCSEQMWFECTDDYITKFVKLFHVWTEVMARHGHYQWTDTSLEEQGHELTQSKMGENGKVAEMRMGEYSTRRETGEPMEGVNITLNYFHHTSTTVL